MSQRCKIEMEDEEAGNVSHLESESAQILLLPSYAAECDLVSQPERAVLVVAADSTLQRRTFVLSETLWSRR